MKYFIAFFQSTQNRNRIFHRRFIHSNRLETTFQRCIFLNILTILIQCGCTDTVEFTSRQHRLQHIAGIHSTFTLAGPNDRVKLINEKNNVSIAIFYFLKNRFQTFLKFTTILRTGNKRSHIQSENLLILQSFRHITTNDSLCKAFHGRRFTDTGFTNQNRIILRLA